MKANQCLYTPTDWNRECEFALHRVMLTVRNQLRLYTLSTTGILYLDAINDFDMQSKENLDNLLMFGK